MKLGRGDSADCPLPFVRFGSNQRNCIGNCFGRIFPAETFRIFFFQHPTERTHIFCEVERIGSFGYGHHILLTQQPVQGDLRWSFSVFFRQSNDQRQSEVKTAQRTPGDHHDIL